MVPNHKYRRKQTTCQRPRGTADESLEEPHSGDLRGYACPPEGAAPDGAASVSTQFDSYPDGPPSPLAGTTEYLGTLCGAAARQVREQGG